ncbi:formimidoylglutamase [Bacillus carboniphilus]|uniref:Formimidoylglutamase n=1 Tax=Bacillus carboniphilus TaxID=86663 RepID=A0ABY9JVH7_9BACI|nr:formimidoylglutamase [Bacillus carboniphilus]WLR42467.1 formimidoylglutamase [Bacillus carboniphilus]
MSNLPFLKGAGKATFQDRHVTKIADCLEEWSGQQSPPIGLVGIPLSKPSISHSGASFSPHVIRNMLQKYSTYSMEEDLDLKELPITDFGDIDMHVTDLVECQQRIEKTVEQLTNDHKDTHWIFIGGDHSISCPTITGLQRNKGKVGVIQFDAHHDLRNVEDGGPTNGTPFRRLLESSAIKGDHLIQIGIRDFSNAKAYSQYGESHHVTMFSMKDVKEHPPKHMIKKCIDQLKDEVDSIYVSVDMDVLDQAFAPGCPAIGPGGMTSDYLLESMFLLGQEKKVEAIDIVEIDPTVDFRDMTSRVAAHVILQFLKGRLVLQK